MTRKIKCLDSLLASSVFNAALAFYSYIALYANSEGRADENLFLGVLSKWFYTIFPLTLLSQNSINNYTQFYMFWLLNVVLNIFIISIVIYSLTKETPKIKRFTATYISLWISLLPLFLFVFFLFFDTK